MSKHYVGHGIDRLSSLEGLPLAPFHIRAAAMVVDLALLNIISLLGSLLWAWWTSKTISSLHFQAIDAIHTWWAFLALVVYFSVSTFFGSGQSPGKRLCRIRVVSLVHERLGMWHCVERALGYAASTLELGFGFLQYFVHPNAQTVHDRIAETIVVSERRARKSAT